MESASFRRLGRRICTACLERTGKYYIVEPDAESMRALRKEVHYCTNCDLTAIGEDVPKSLSDFFDQYPEETPEHERIL